MTNLETNFRLGMKCKDLFLVFEGFVGKKVQANFGSGDDARFSQSSD